jgi:hypothetical protein
LRKRSPENLSVSKRIILKWYIEIGVHWIELAKDRILVCFAAIW